MNNKLGSHMRGRTWETKKCRAPPFIFSHAYWTDLDHCHSQKCSVHLGQQWDKQHCSNNQNGEFYTNLSNLFLNIIIFVFSFLLHTLDLMKLAKSWCIFSLCKQNKTNTVRNLSKSKEPDINCRLAAEDIILGRANVQLILDITGSSIVTFKIHPRTSWLSDKKGIKVWFPGKWLIFFRLYI